MQVEMFREGLRFVETLFFQQKHEKYFLLLISTPPGTLRNALPCRVGYYEYRESMWNIVHLRTMFHQ